MSLKRAVTRFLTEIKPRSIASVLQRNSIPGIRELPSVEQENKKKLNKEKAYCGIEGVKSRFGNCAKPINSILERQVAHHPSQVFYIAGAVADILNRPLPLALTLRSKSHASAAENARYFPFSNISACARDRK